MRACSTVAGWAVCNNECVLEFRQRNRVSKAAQLNSAAIVWVCLKATTGLISGSTANCVTTPASPTSSYFTAFHYMLCLLTVANWGLMVGLMLLFFSQTLKPNFSICMSWQKRRISINIDRKTMMQHFRANMVRRPDRSVDMLLPKHHFSPLASWQMQLVAQNTANIQSEFSCFHPVSTGEKHTVYYPELYHLCSNVFSS